jgi:hypothetical protein
VLGDGSEIVQRRPEYDGAAAAPADPAGHVRRVVDPDFLEADGAHPVRDFGGAGVLLAGRRGAAADRHQGRNRLHCATMRRRRQTALLSPCTASVAWGLLRAQAG